MTIDILCKVVDNFGDIGVVFRLARALRDADPKLELRLIVDDLASFAALEPALDPDLAVQDLGAWKLIRWDFPWEGFRDERPRFILETFSCGRPEWLDELLFDPEDLATKHILNIEHLSAQEYAQDFHRLPSATRSARVKKWFFMPGFTEKTGGLTIDRAFAVARETFLDPRSRAAARFSALASAGLPAEAEYERHLWVSVFSYEQDYGAIVEDLAVFSRARPLLVLAASGKSQACFRRAWENAEKPFPLLCLPFLDQATWDSVLLASDFAIVRGEESLSRAALSGRPFLWQAYVQEEKHQLVKVRALLDRMRPFFDPSAFEPLERLFLAFNDREGDSPEQSGGEKLLPFLEALPALAPGFRAFSEKLFAYGDFAEKLLAFLKNPCAKEPDGRDWA